MMEIMRDEVDNQAMKSEVLKERHGYNLNASSSCPG